MKPKKKNDSQIQEKLDYILKNAKVDYHDRPHYCEYKGHEERYCKITTHTTCKGCRFFSPNMLMRNRLVVEQYDALEDEIRDRDHKLKDSQKTIDALHGKVDIFKRLSMNYCPDAQRCHPKEFDHIELVKVEKRKLKGGVRFVY